MTEETANLLATIEFAATTALRERDVRIWRAALRDIRRLTMEHAARQPEATTDDAGVITFNFTAGSSDGWPSTSGRWIWGD